MTRTASILLLLLLACGRERATPAAAAWPTARSACAAPTGPRHDWRHRRSELVARLGDAHHVASDAIVAAGATTELHGKVAYGKISKDLEEEDVVVFLSSAGPRGDCAPRQLGTATTNDDGRVSFDAGKLAAGFHRYWLIVAGDGTTAEAGVWVLPGPTPAVIFDVDGTLTTSDGELFDDLIGSGAAAFDGAAAVAQRWADKGYLIVYVTGRPYPLRALTRRWLDAGGFPDGPLFTPERLRDGVPTRDGVGAYKREAFTTLQASGLRVVRAYGNAATDVCAYAQAGIPPALTYIIGTPTPCDAFTVPHALAGYVDHLADVERQPTVR